MHENNPKSLALIANFDPNTHLIDTESSIFGVLAQTTYTRPKLEYIAENGRQYIGIIGLSLGLITGPVRYQTARRSECRRGTFYIVDCVHTHCCVFWVCVCIVIEVLFTLTRRPVFTSPKISCLVSVYFECRLGRWIKL